MSQEIVINPSKVKGIGELIDCSDEEFIKHFKDKDLGYCLNTYKLLNLTFEQLECMIKDLKEKNTEEALNTVQALYVNMGYIEHKATILRKEIETRKSI